MKEEANMKEGIIKSSTDTVQPYRVWYRGNIVWFAYTLLEAEDKLHWCKTNDIRGIYTS